MTTKKPEVFEIYQMKYDTLEKMVLLADYEVLQAELEREKAVLREALREAEHFLTQIGPVHWPSKQEAHRIIGIVRDALTAHQQGGDV